MSLEMFNIDSKYVDYLASCAPHLFRNRKVCQNNGRKYIGVVLKVNQMHYYAPLSSYKEKHHRMPEMVDFKKIKNMAVLNLNDMFPVPDNCFKRVDIPGTKNPRYRNLLMNEYRVIRSRQAEIKRDAIIVYNHKIKYGDSTKLARRCLDFKLLEEKCMAYTKRP